MRWPAVWVVVAAWLLLGLAFAYLFPYLSYRSGGEGFGPGAGQTTVQLLGSVLPSSVPTAMLQGTPLFGGALMLVLGAMVAGNSYGWGTVKTVLTQGPSRNAVIVGTILTVLGTVALVVLVGAGADLGVAYALAAAEGADTSLPAFQDLARSVGTGFLVLGMWAVFGLALGTLTRGPALSVGLGVVWVLALENLLRGVAALLPAVDTVTQFLPGTAAGSLVGAVTAGATTPGVLDVLTGDRAAWTLAAYLVALALLTTVVVRRRDVS